MKLTMTPQQFLSEYWQKKPLLIRQAFPDFDDLLTSNELAGLACEEDAQSRLVLKQRGQWKLETGPFAESRFTKLPKKDWTLLVQGINHFVPEAMDLLQQFNFIPSARLDDLMVSYAPDGGGVGPHFDSYDVFLLQGQGQRLWRISEQTDRTLVKDAPLKILQNFQTQQEWLLEPGDMLYLPPQYAHWGIAVGECMTYSIGFRAPAAQELVTEFLGFLQEHVQLQGLYEDPDLQIPMHPAEISAQMVGKVATMFKAIAWQNQDVAHFLGQYLTEPKTHILFTSPRRLSFDKFCARLALEGVCLALTSQMLFYGDMVFINGECVEVELVAQPLLQQLANARFLPPIKTPSDDLARFLYQWYQAGYVLFR
ncbi:MAG: cupin domain-containing protein [Methylophilales bacterium]|nr:cupin domain-containing protein [Methylophilales bacterium]